MLAVTVLTVSPFAIVYTSPYALTTGSGLVRGGGIVSRFAKIRPGARQWNQFQQVLKATPQTASQWYQRHQALLANGLRIEQAGEAALGGLGWLPGLPTPTPGGIAGGAISELRQRITGQEFVGQQ